MQSILVLAAVLFAAPMTQACDEQCKREAAETKNASEFPSFLTWNYCEGLKRDFMSVDISSLQSYSGKHFNTKYKGPIKNIIKLIDQRKDWLKECDVYISQTTDKRLFDDKKTTDAVFANMQTIKSELEAVLSGVTYSSVQGDETKKIVTEKFQALFQTIDDHNNLMHLKGKYVYQ